MTDKCNIMKKYARVFLKEIIAENLGTQIIVQARVLNI